MYHKKDFHPLGHIKHSGIDLPQFVNEKDFMFGVKMKKGDEIKTIVNPTNPPDDTVPEIHRLYLKSHHDYFPGERKDYTYTVPEPVIPTYKSITTAKRIENGKYARECLHWIPEEYSYTY
jgi:hypothetical protein